MSAICGVMRFASFHNRQIGKFLTYNILRANPQCTAQTQLSPYVAPVTRQTFLNTRAERCSILVM